MTVGELIRQLKRLDLDQRIAVCVEGEPEAHDIEGVEQSESDGGFWTDSRCDGPAGGKEPTAQLRIIL